MSPVKIAQSFIGHLVIFILFCGVIINIADRQAALRQAIQSLEMPQTLEEVRQAQRSILHMLNTDYAHKYDLWQAHSLITAQLEQNTLYNFSVIKVPGDRLYRGNIYPLNDKATLDLAGSIIELNKLGEKSGARMFYLSTPGCVLKGKGPLPDDMPVADFNGPIDTLLYTLRENGIAHLDTRYTLIEQGFSATDTIMKTDVQMTARATFSIFGSLVESMEATFGITLDPDGVYKNPDNYRFTPFHGFYLGQFGKETGPQFSGYDEFVTVEPLLEQQYFMEAVDMFGNFFKATGNAEETLFEPRALTYSANPYTFYPQSFYKHSNTAWSKIDNLQKDNGLSLLFIHDSYTAQLVGHLAPLFKSVHTISRQEAFSINAEQYLQGNQIDIILISFNPQTLTDRNLPQVLLEEAWQP